MFKPILDLKQNTILATMDMQKLKGSKLDQLRAMSKAYKTPEDPDDDEILGIQKACNDLWLKDKKLLKADFPFYEAQHMRANCLEPGDIFLPGVCHKDPPKYHPYICLSRDHSTNTIYVNLCRLGPTQLSDEEELEPIALKDLFIGILNNDLVTLYVSDF